MGRESVKGVGRWVFGKLGGVVLFHAKVYSAKVILLREICQQTPPTNVLLMPKVEVLMPTPPLLTRTDELFAPIAPLLMPIYELLKPIARLSTLKVR